MTMTKRDSYNKYLEYMIDDLDRVVDVVSDRNLEHVERIRRIADDITWLLDNPPFLRLTKADVLKLHETFGETASKESGLTHKSFVQRLKKLGIRPAKKPYRKVQRTEFVDVYNRCSTYKEMARELGVSMTSVWAYRKTYGLPPKRKQRAKNIDG